MTHHRYPDATEDVSPPDTPESGALECREVVLNFWDYRDGNFSSDLARRVEAHAFSCIPCRRLQRFEERFFALLADVRRRSPAPRRLRDRVRRAIGAERAASRAEGAQVVATPAGR